MRRARRAGTVKIGGWGYKLGAPNLAPPQVITKSIYFPIGYNTGVITSGNQQWYFFRGNDLFDPDYQAGGRTATGMKTQFATYYRKYMVMGCKASATAYSLDDSADPTPIPVTFGPVYDDDNTGTTPPTMSITIDPQATASEIAGYPWLKPKFIYRGTAQQNCGKNFKHFKAKYFSTKQIIPECDPSENTGLTGISGTGASPSRQWFFAAGVVNCSGDDVTVLWNIKLEYYVKFFGRKPTGSTQG